MTFWFCHPLLYLKSSPCHLTQMTCSCCMAISPQGIVIITVYTQRQEETHYAISLRTAHHMELVTDGYLQSWLLPTSMTIAIDSSWQDIKLGNWYSFLKISATLWPRTDYLMSQPLHLLQRMAWLASLTLTACLVREMGEENIHKGYWGLWLPYLAILRGVPQQSSLWASGPCGWEFALEGPMSPGLCECF